MTDAATSWAQEDLARLDRAGLRRVLEPHGGRTGARIEIDGVSFLNFSSNDYLGLAGDPRLAAAAAEALGSHGTGAGASRLITGDTDLHRALERRAARFLDAPAATLFNSGYAANVGILQALCGPEDSVFSDELNHASLIDGCRLSRARVHVYPHRDVAVLEGLLASTSARRKLVCTDAVFSMDGDLAPVEELAELCGRYGAALLVDEAHAIGVLGPEGRGLCAALGVTPDVRMATLGKALGGFGAFAATSRPIADLLVNRARSLVFSTALPPALCAAGITAIDIAESDQSRREGLHRNMERVAGALDRSATSAVFSMVSGTPEAAIRAAAVLRSRGVLAKPIRPPTVPEGTSRLRLSLMATHTPADIDRLLEALAAVPEMRRAA